MTQDSIELEQRLVDMGDDMKEAVVELSQALADIAEKFSGHDTDKLEAILSAISKDLGESLKRDGARQIAEALLKGLKALTITAPAVNVTVENKVPAQPAPVVNITGAKKWKHTFEYDTSTGLLKSSTSTRIE